MLKNLCTAAIAALLLPTVTSAQDSDLQVDLFSQSVEVRVVNVDVHVTDKKGRPVTGLTQDDFVLTEDGQPAAISYFYSSQGEALTSKPDEPREIPTFATRAEDLVVVIYVDNYWLTPQERKRVLDDIERFVEAHPPGRTRFLLVTHDSGIQIRTPLTTNPQPVLTALAELPGEPAQGLRGPRARSAFFDSIRSIWDSYSGLGANVGALAGADDGSSGGGGAEAGFTQPGLCQPCDCGWQQMLSVWEAYAVDIGRGIQVADGGLRELLSALAGLPDRKAVLYVGSGIEQRPGLDILQYLIELCPNRQPELAYYAQRYDESRTLLDLGAVANSSRATLYPLDAGGLRADSVAAVDIADAELRPSSLISQIERANLQASFQILASATGGRAILNANQPFEELLDLESDFEHVYSLGFEPPGEADGRVHQLRVKLADKKKTKGMNMRFRRSYVDKPLEQRLVDRAIATMAFGAATNPLGVEATLGVTETLSKDAINIPIHIAVTKDNLALIPSSTGEISGQFRVFLAARSVDGQRTILREKFFRVSPTESGDGFERVTINMRLEPDDYTIGVGVRDEIGTETSYLALKAASTPVG